MQTYGSTDGLQKLLLSDTLPFQLNYEDDSRFLSSILCDQSFEYVVMLGLSKADPTFCYRAAKYVRCGAVELLPRYFSSGEMCSMPVDRRLHRHIPQLIDLGFS